MGKNIIAAQVAQIDDPKLREVLVYIIGELDRIKSLPPVTEDLKQITTIVNKITRSL